MTFPPPALQLRLCDPADVLAAIPYLLGFHPRDSVVIMGVARHRLIFHARGDLPPAHEILTAAPELAQGLATILNQQSVEEALLVGFGPPERVTPVMDACRPVIRSLGITLLDQIRVEKGRFWSYLCDDPACCPPEGRPYAINGTVVAAEATLAGCVAYPDRESLVATLGPPTGRALADIRRRTRRAQRRVRNGRTRVLTDGRAALESAILRYVRGRALSDDEVAWLTVLLAADRRLRDVAVAAVGGADGTGIPLSVHVAMWSDVVRRCDPGVAETPSVLLAYVCWCSGDGVRSSIAVDRARQSDPGCTAASLMAEVLRRGIPPGPFAPEVFRRSRGTARPPHRRMRGQGPGTDGYAERGPGCPGPSPTPAA